MQARDEPADAEQRDQADRDLPSDERSRTKRVALRSTENAALIDR
ncbi:hypothetical protein KY49_888 [Burkholderia sp. MSHR3999]|nr:hypothetical protein KY49_888 [Burkholderia sp. MSHR3999]